MAAKAKGGANAAQAEARRKALVSRISMSLSEELLTELDAMVGERGFASRSQAVSTMLHRALVEHRHNVGDRVMVGIITLFHDNKTKDLQAELAALQHDNIAEVISSLHIHLMHNQTLEVVLVQGPARKIQAIADGMIARKGVMSGRLELVAALIPQVHPFKPIGN